MGNASMTLGLSAGFPEWSEVMTGWGDKMLAAVHTVAHMAAIGFALPPDAFTERMLHGPHLLAPTGTSATALTVPATALPSLLCVKTLMQERI